MCPVEIVSTADRPALCEVTARWRWEAFVGPAGDTLERVLADERDAAEARALMPTTLVCLADGRPVGMASLAEDDLESRPDLNPWLAGVYVAPDARGRGYATRLVAAVEALARDASIPVLWLYTRSAESLYARAGWRTTERFEREGKLYALMRRDLARQGEAGARSA